MLYFRTPMTHLVECFISAHQWHTWWNALFQHTYLCPRKSMGALCLWPCKCPTYIVFPWQLSRNRMCPVSLYWSYWVWTILVYLWPYERPSDVWPITLMWYMSRPSASRFVFTVYIKWLYLDFLMIYHFCACAYLLHKCSDVGLEILWSVLGCKYVVPLFNRVDVSGNCLTCGFQVIMFQVTVYLTCGFQVLMFHVTVYLTCGFQVIMFHVTVYLTCGFQVLMFHVTVYLTCGFQVIMFHVTVYLTCGFQVIMFHVTVYLTCGFHVTMFHVTVYLTCGFQVIMFHVTVYLTCGFQVLMFHVTVYLTCGFQVIMFHVTVYLTCGFQVIMFHVTVYLTCGFQVIMFHVTVYLTCGFQVTPVVWCCLMYSIISRSVPIQAFVQSTCFSSLKHNTSLIFSQW